MHQVEIPVNKNSFKDIVLTASAGIGEIALSL